MKRFPARAFVPALYMSGYRTSHLAQDYFRHFPQFTAEAVDERLARHVPRVEEAARSATPVFISLGQTCGPAYRLKRISAATLGSSYFDNIVLSDGSLETLLADDFRQGLALSNLVIDRWEGMDSVYDRQTQVWYHHYFHLRGSREKKRDGRRLIEPADIPLFYSGVRARFEYLAAKFLLTLRSDVRKVYVHRRSDGAPASPAQVESLLQALERAGGRNFDLAVVHALGQADPAVASRHTLIAEPDAGERRWGSDEDWAALVRRFA